MELNLILASTSPRRQELIQLLNLPYTCVSADCDETITPCTPEDTVCQLSKRKAEAALAFHTLQAGDVLIGADTVVAIDGQILGKPKDDQDAYNMIAMMSDKTHSVYTGVTLITTRETRTFYEETRVTVAPLSDTEIRSYLATGEHRDKAGAYGIQGAFGLYVTGIRGDYNNVVGFPVARIYQELQNLENISQRD
ncbi:MAG: septum formation protein Maf [Clostridia bacterium]|nr:septum formation protein Maf [Clostridia bacterium]